MKPGFNKALLFVLLPTLLIFLVLGSVFSADKTSIALIMINNYSGVDKIGGNNLVNTIGNLLKDNLKKENAIEFFDTDQTQKMLQKADLSVYYDTSNLCTTEDLTRIGNKIGVASLAIIEINGYNEIKKEGSQKSYQLLIGLRVYNCLDGTDMYYEAEGFGDGDRNKAFTNAVTLLTSDYLNHQTVDPNTGNIRANDVAVVGNKVSNYYHLTETNHQPKPENQVAFKTRTEAEQDTYRPCPVCFPPYKSFVSRDRSLEENLGGEACGTIEYYYRLANEPKEVARLQKIMDTLLTDTIRKNYDYKFRILDTDEVNSFAAPNGYIYITQGLLDIVESDDEIALVIAHEMGHLEKKHAVIRYKQALAVAFFSAILIGGSKNSDEQTASLVAIVMASLILKGYSREQEREADEIAVTHLKHTKLDYLAYRVVFGKFIDMRKRKLYAIEKIFSTHPAPEDRISKLDSYLKAYENLQAKLK